MAKEIREQYKTSPLDPGRHLPGFDMTRLLPLHTTWIDRNNAGCRKERELACEMKNTCVENEMGYEMTHLFGELVSMPVHESTVHAQGLVRWPPPDP